MFLNYNDKTDLIILYAYVYQENCFLYQDWLQIMIIHQVNKLQTFFSFLKLHENAPSLAEVKLTNLMKLQNFTYVFV